MSPRLGVKPTILIKLASSTKFLMAWKTPCKDISYAWIYVKSWDDIYIVIFIIYFRYRIMPIWCRSSLIHFACIGVALPRLFTPAAWTVNDERSSKNISMIRNKHIFIKYFWGRRFYTPRPTHTAEGANSAVRKSNCFVKTHEDRSIET